MARMIHGVMLCLVTVATLSVSVGCSRSGDVSGTLYGVTAGGDAKRGADVEVVLVRSSETLRRELHALEEAFTREVRPARVAFEEAQRRALDSTAGTEASPFHQDLSIEAASARSAARRSSDQATELAVKIASVRQTYREKGRALLLQAKAAAVRTDATGSFAFKGVKGGEYLIFAEWSVQRIQYSGILSPYPVTDHMDWLVPISVTAGPQRIDLSTSNSGWALSWEG